MEFSHIYELDNYFKKHRYPVPLNDILNHFGYGKNTFHRIRTHMCDYLGAPIKNKRGRGYYYDLKSGETFELPGLWFTDKEMVSLALLEQISQSLQPPLVKELLHPVTQRLQARLHKQSINDQDWQNRIKVTSQWQRQCEPTFFTEIAFSLLTRKQLQISYWQWQTDQIDTRIISPQRLVYYRDNWYLDAWCHKRDALRTFLLDNIQQIQRLKNQAIDIPFSTLDNHVMPGYGIFAGKVKDIATLRFSKPISKRVSRENWHPDQQADWTAEGNYLLSIPYSDNRELIRDILHFGSEVEVLSPADLREDIAQEIQKMQKNYR
ncbi:putative transcriptional regulator [Methylophaga frappieri]|uniref:Putative transcriptional regulator n=1 Tax=Methylophaga frappieri (strain ATCC BAA-2434 / DSM 25690 / JAM7) TaxID=754477 RepID=I1YH13_METFJ|nr:WYL domain-containing protein [Methylophaga frappieri]AFJ02206.1 putative transcriptional regulator [Methylophaga frappieri]